MAATVSSPWSKPGAWALDVEQHEAELLNHKTEPIEAPTADFPSLSVAAATKTKKKKDRTFSLAEFNGATSVKESSAPKGLTPDELFTLPTGPRERTAEELERSRLGGGFRSYGTNRYSNDDDSSNSRWGSNSRVSDETRRQGSFGRDANREFTSSKADEVDDWLAEKKSMVGNGFERRERGGGYFENGNSQSKADESENWTANKSFVSVEGRRFGGNSGGGFDRERRGRFGEVFTNGGDADNWGKKKEERNGIVAENGTSRRPRLSLQPRTLPVNNNGQQLDSKPKGANPFGEARPREEVLAEKGKDWKKIDEQLESMKIKEVGDGKAERSWRKPDCAEVQPTRADKTERGGENGSTGES